MSKVILAVPVLAIALSLGCADASSPPVDRTTFGSRASVWLPDSSAAIAHEYYSGFVDATDLVITDSPSWVVTWAQIYARLRPQPSLPAVDFRTERVVLAALGQRNTGGYDIRIDSVVHFQRGRVTYVAATAPGRGCFTTQALSRSQSISWGPPAGYAAVQGTIRLGSGVPGPNTRVNITRCTDPIGGFFGEDVSDQQGGYRVHGSLPPVGVIPRSTVDSLLVRCDVCVGEPGAAAVVDTVTVRFAASRDSMVPIVWDLTLP